MSFETWQKDNTAVADQPEEEQNGFAQWQQENMATPAATIIPKQMIPGYTPPANEEAFDPEMELTNAPKTQGNYPPTITDQIIGGNGALMQMIAGKEGAKQLAEMERYRTGQLNGDEIDQYKADKALVGPYVDAGKGMGVSPSAMYLKEHPDADPAEFNNAMARYGRANMMLQQAGQLDSVLNLGIDPQQNKMLASMTPDQRQELYKSKGKIGLSEDWNAADKRDYMLYSGLLSTSKLIEVKDAADRLQANNYKHPLGDENAPRKQADQNIVQDYIFNMEEAQARGFSIPASVSDVLLHMIPYAGEIMLGNTPATALGNIVNSGTRGVLKKAAFEATAKKAIGLRIGGFVARELGDASAGAAWALLNPQNIANSYMERRMPYVQVTPDNGIQVTPEGQAPMVSLLKAMLEQSVSYFTETQGKLLEKPLEKSMAALAEKFPGAPARLLSALRVQWLKSGKKGELLENMLKRKGSSSAVKVGTKVKSIRLVEGHDGHNIDCKIDGFGAMTLKSEFVKKI